jgi:hypothetical protein
VLLTETFSVSLSLLKVGILGCVAMDIVPPDWTALGRVRSECLCPQLLWCDGPSGISSIS